MIVKDQPTLNGFLDKLETLRPQLLKVINSDIDSDTLADLRIVDESLSVVYAGAANDQISADELEEAHVFADELETFLSELSEKACICLDLSNKAYE